MSENHQNSFISDQVVTGQYYYIDLHNRDSQASSVVCGGIEQCAAHYCMKREGFHYYSIEYVASGSGTLTLRNKTVPLHLGALFCYGPGIPHCIASDPDVPLLKHFVDFKGTSLIQQLRNSLLFRQPLFMNNPSRVGTIFDQLMQSGSEESQHRAELCTLLIKHLLLLVDEHAVPLDTALSRAWQTYLRCRQHLEQHCLDLNSIETLSRQCHIDKAYLCRLFKRYARETPHHVLTRLKMSRAADLLARQTTLVKQAARAVGYEDPYHFSRVFKHIYGISPERFIQTARR